MMYYRISKNEKNLLFGKKNRPGVGSDLKCFNDISLNIVLKQACFHSGPICTMLADSREEGDH